MKTYRVAITETLQMTVEVEATSRYEAERLVEQRWRDRNTQNRQWSNYYNFKIIHYTKSNQWQIKTDYATYGGESLNWIDRYANTWDINIAQYFTA